MKDSTISMMQISAKGLLDSLSHFEKRGEDKKYWKGRVKYWRDKLTIDLEALKLERKEKLGL